MSQPKSIELFSGIVASSTVYGDGEPRIDHSRAGQRVYFVDLVEADGGRFCLFDSANPDEAMATAQLCARDFALPMVIEGGTA